MLSRVASSRIFRLILCDTFTFIRQTKTIFMKPSAILSRRGVFSFRESLHDKSSRSSLSGVICIKNLCESRNFLVNNGDASVSDLPRCCYVTCLEKRERSIRTRVEQVGRGAKIPGIKSPLIPTKTITLLLLAPS